MYRSRLYTPDIFEADLMATYMYIMVAAFLVFSSADGSDAVPPRSREVMVAIEEMTAAGYFTFVTLINMAPPDLIQGNVTFFMPDDRMLSEISFTQEDVSGLLLRHLVPSPLLLDHLIHIPKGSIIPTSAPGYIMKIDNCRPGRSHISLNGAKVIRPDVCVTGSSIRCHGIGGVLPAVKMPYQNNCSVNDSASGASANNAMAPDSLNASSPLPPPAGSPTAPPLPDEYRRNSVAPRSSKSSFLSVSQACSIVAGLVLMRFV